MRIPVELGAQSYCIIIENGALDNIGDLLDLNRKVLVVTDSGVPETYAEKVAARCCDPTVVTVPQGEKSKSPESTRLFGAFKEEKKIRYAHQPIRHSFCKPQRTFQKLPFRRRSISLRESFRHR